MGHQPNVAVAEFCTVSPNLAYHLWKHGRALRTESYDDNGPVGEDSRWDTFAELHRVLEASFPRVYVRIFKFGSSFHNSCFVSSYESLNITKVNTYGLAFHWQGSTTAKPYILAAHQGYSRLNTPRNFS
jgi:Gly-Xaa carboxypeptidase